MEDIKYGQLWARHSELVSNSDVGNYRVNFEGLKNAIDEALRGVHPCAVWVKATTRVPLDENLYHLNFGTSKTKMKTTGFYDGEKWHRQDGALLDWHPNLEWLDESGTATAGREEDVVKFAEWLYENFKGYDPIADKWVYGEDEKRYTIKELYKIFKP